MTIDVNGPAKKGAGLFGLDTPLADAKVVVLPVPFEATVSFSAGTARGPAAILAASHQVDLLDADVGSPWQSGIALDPGFSWLPELNEAARQAACRCIDAITNGQAARDGDRQLVEEAGLRVNRAVTERCAEHLRDGRIAVVVGGDHSVSYGAIAATAAAMGDRRLGILHIDAHADLRDAYEGFTWSHASVMRSVVERMPNVRLVQVGIRDFCEAEVELIRAQPGRITTYFDAHLRAARLAGHWATVCAAIINELPENVYLSIDIDGLEPSACPSTGTPVPGGLSFDELVSLVDLLVHAGRRIVGLDLVEVAPDAALADNDLGLSWDANVGARLLYKLIGFALLSRGSARPDLPKAPGIR
ncbi:MAG: agmatinase family protein [Deltaproteobacteria bacterium]|nr:agmatinase family protein [Deltaproteobacteria bacterium]